MIYNYNLHSHSLLSDGVLLPSEVARRYEDKGYSVLAITDHADYSNIEDAVSGVLGFARHWPRDSRIKVLSGIELTHLPLEQFTPLAVYARDKGVNIIIAHGETLMEPVIRGTNRAALEADIDILAHPGLISEEDVKLAREKGVFLEVTTRHGHAQANSHVIKQALQYGANLVLNNDSHTPEDIISPEEMVRFARELGLAQAEIEHIYQAVGRLIQKREGI